MRTLNWLLSAALLGGVAISADPAGCGAETDNDGDGWTIAAGDCDDANPTINPEAIDACDGVDNNCDGIADEGFDTDGDGVSSCNGDCDDTNPAIGPHQAEACNAGEGVDDDCDGVVDEGLDADGDGVRACDGDCDDTSADVSPQAAEQCSGGAVVDDDCDGSADEGFDVDGDGFTLCGSDTVGSDCDDGDASIFPGADEACNGLDDDCDGLVDQGFDEDQDGQTSCGGDCDDGDAAVYAGAEEACSGIDEDCDGTADEGFDADGDGFRVCDGDCDDGSAAVFPGAAEVCDGQDNSCDGTVDEGFDQDGDGYFSCEAAGPLDCDDADSSVNPGADEACNNRDDDCDGAVDNGFDQDGDGYASCAQGSRPADCDDGSATTFPGASETCNFTDDDCDSAADEGFDGDGDGYTVCGGDCDDGRASVNPGAQEGPGASGTTGDGRDNDCDGYVDIDCDGTAPGVTPRVEIETPGRGLFTSSSSVSVSGLAYPSADRVPVTGVTIGGSAASVQACSDDGGVRFSGSKGVGRGLTTLAVVATDAAALSDKAETSVVYSNRFIPLRSGPVSDSLVGELNQGSWNLLGEFLEGYLDDDDLEAEILAANPIINERGDDDCLESWSVVGDATAYTHQDVQITFSISGGKVRSTARLVRPELWASGKAKYDLEWYCGGWSDTVNMSAYARFDDVVATADGVLSMYNGKPRVVFQNIAVNANNPHLDVDASGSIYDWLIDLFEDDLEDELEQFVEDELYDFVAQDLGPLLSDELAALELSYDIEVEGVTYDVAFEVEDLAVPTGTVDVGFSVEYDYLVDERIPLNPGAIGHPTNYSRTTGPTVAFKVGMDFFNSAFHALWEGGSLHIAGNLSSNPPIYAAATPLLPPVVVPASSPYLMTLQLGEVLAEVDIEASDGSVSTLTAAMSASVPMDIDPQVDGYSIWFDANFGAVDLSFDVLGEESIGPELQASMEEGLSEMLTLYLDELEVYVEALEISYLELPLTFSSLSIAKDSSNGAMLTVSGNATYAGP